VFVVIRVIPGDPALVIAGIDSSQSDIDAIRTMLGTDKPIFTQYVQWVWDVLRFDFGDSMISGQPVMRLILERFPLTLSLALLGILISIIIAIPLGVISAVKRWSLWDYMGMGFSQIGLAIPGYSIPTAKAAAPQELRYHDLFQSTEPEAPSVFYVKFAAPKLDLFLDGAGDPAPNDAAYWEYVLYSHPFDPEALAAIFKYSRGLPRKICKLCDNALIRVQSSGVKGIDKTIIDMVAEEIRLDIREVADIDLKGFLVVFLAGIGMN